MQSGNLSEFSDEIASTTEKRLQKLFSRVFPHRSISFKENTVFASGDISSGDDYNSCEMSDGERAGLYVMAQALCLPEGSTVIVDEPELHLHPAIITSLWQEIEKERVDCLFLSLLLIVWSLPNIILIPIEFGSKVMMEKHGNMKLSLKIKKCQVHCS